MLGHVEMRWSSDDVLDEAEDLGSAREARATYEVT
jgi:hypothetical protein